MVPLGVVLTEEVETTDAPVWVQGGAIGNRHLLDRVPIAYTCGRKPRWPNDGANASMGHWVLMVRPEQRSGAAAVGDGEQ